MFSHADYVYAVYQERSFTKAAEKLYVSQPALSATVRKLEKDLGYPIFERGIKEVVPTAIGMKYIEAAEQVLAISKQLQRQTDDLLQLRTGSITVGSTTFIASYLLPGLLREFGKMYPGITVNLLVEQSTILQEKLEKGMVDIAIDNTLSCNEEYEYCPLFTERIIVGVPEEYPINQKLVHLQLPANPDSWEQIPKLDIAQLAECPFILLKSGNNMRQTAGGIFSEKGIRPKISYEFDQLMTSISFAQNGLGVCFLTDTLLRCGQTCKGLLLYQPDTAFPRRTLYAIRKKNKYLPTAAQALLEFLNDHTKKGTPR